MSRSVNGFYLNDILANTCILGLVLKNIQIRLTQLKHPRRYN